MSRVRVLVVEDDILHAANLEMILKDLNYEMIAVADNTVEALQLFRETNPDLLLLDINLGEKTDSIDLAEQINEIASVPIIYTTSVKDKKTIDRAKTTNPYAYLIKPIERASLQATIELTLYKFEQSTYQKQVTNDYSIGWKQGLIMKDSFFIKSSNCIEKIDYMDVLWIEVTGDRYLNIKTLKCIHPLRSSLNALSKKLSPSYFVRIHRSYIVNIKHIQSINDYDLLINVSGYEIPLGKSYKSALIGRLDLLN